MRALGKIGNTNALRHGHTRGGAAFSPTYRSWAAMMTRCFNPRHGSWPGYGGRGITVCDRWRSFENFLADMGERPPDTSLDRYPNRPGNYEPGNCRWATALEQARNTNRCRTLLMNGQSIALGDLSALLGVPRTTLLRRLDAGTVPGVVQIKNEGEP